MKKMLFFAAFLCAGLMNVNASSVSNNAVEMSTMMVANAETGTYTGPLSNVIMNGRDVTSSVTEDGTFELSDNGDGTYSLTGSFTIGHPFTLKATVTIDDAGNITLLNGGGTVDLSKFGMGQAQYVVSNFAGTLVDGKLSFSMGADVASFGITASFDFEGTK